MNLAVINIKTKQVAVFGKEGKLVSACTFDRMLDRDEVEGFRKDPKGFLAEAITPDNESIPEDQQV